MISYEHVTGVSRTCLPPAVSRFMWDGLGAVKRGCFESVYAWNHKYMLDYHMSRLILCDPDLDVYQTMTEIVFRSTTFRVMVHGQDIFTDWYPLQ